MNVITAIAAEGPFFIPEVAGQELKQFEQSVNGLMKLALKLHSMKLDHLVLLSGRSTLLHHRFSVTSGSSVVRTFSDIRDDAKITSLEFASDPSFIQTFEIQMRDLKVPVELIRQQGNVNAIDDGALSLLYYCEKIGYKPKVTIIGMTDLSLEKYHTASKALARTLRIEPASTAVIAFGTLVSGSTQSAELVQAIQSEVPNYELEKCDVSTQLEDQNSLFKPASLLLGMYREWKKPCPPFHKLTDEDTDEGRFLCGYFA